MGDLGWRKQKGKSCLRVVCPCAAYRGISFGLLAAPNGLIDLWAIYNSRNSFGLLALIECKVTKNPLYTVILRILFLEILSPLKKRERYKTNITC